MQSTEECLQKSAQAKFTQLVVLRNVSTGRGDNSIELLTLTNKLRTTKTQRIMHNSTTDTQARIQELHNYF